MRIILATPIYPPEIGGPATYTRELATRLKTQEKITIVALADEGEKIEGVNLVLVAKKQGVLSRTIEYFSVLLREAKAADLIYVQNAVAAGLPAALVGALLKKPVVLKFVGDEAWERATQAGKTRKTLEQFLSAPDGGLKAKFFISIQRFVLNKVSMVVPPSQFLVDTIVRYYGVPQERVQVNYNAFEGTLSSAPAIRKPHQILSVSRLVSWKRVDGILNALKIILNAYPDATLLIAGEGPEDLKLKNLAVELGVGGSVTFLGRTDREQINMLMKESAVSVLNSTYEGLPHIALENFATGTPLVATDIPGTREAVINEQTGLLVPLGDDATLAVAVERVFVDKSLCAKLAQGGYNILKTKFSWDQHIQTLLAVMASVNENKK
jgi:glycosyltransferase involved in cell wall biosynthesis